MKAKILGLSEMIPGHSYLIEVAADDEARTELAAPEEHEPDNHEAIQARMLSSVA